MFQLCSLMTSCRQSPAKAGASSIFAFPSDASIRGLNRSSAIMMSKGICFFLAAALWPTMLWYSFIFQYMVVPGSSTSTCWDTTPFWQHTSTFHSWVSKPTSVLLRLPPPPEIASRQQPQSDCLPSLASYKRIHNAIRRRWAWDLEAFFSSVLGITYDFLYPQLTAPLAEWLRRKRRPFLWLGRRGFNSRHPQRTIRAFFALPWAV